MGRPPKKYHWSTGSRKHDCFELTESDWKAIESEHNYALDKSTRDQILSATRHFLMMAEMERSAALMYPLSPQSEKTSKLNAAELRIKKIKASVNVLLKVLLENPIDEKNKPDFEADHLIMMNCNKLQELGGDRVSGTAVGRRHATRLLADLLSRFLIACHSAEQDLGRKSEYFRDGDAWNEWVASIRDSLKKQGLGITTALSSNPDQPELSQFIRLIKALQKRLPAQFVPPRSSGAALAKAVQRALSLPSQDS
jgi:hypothetical protein